MFVIDPRISIAHLFAPDGHGQESQRRIIEAVIALVSVIFNPIVERQISTEQSGPGIGRRVVSGYRAAFFQGFLAPVEGVDNVVLITAISPRRSAATAEPA